MGKSKQPRLFTYCIPTDDGAAPNPYWGICTLTICKPKIRRSAKIGDWVVGTGSTNSPIGDISKKVVYMMKITDKKTLEEYDSFCKAEYPFKIPDWENKDIRRRLGDCIYDFSSLPATQRNGVHKEKNRDKDLRGKYALISNHFYYFGDKPIDLDISLIPIIKEGVGHQSDLNTPYFEQFIAWVKSLNLKPNKLYGKPQLDIFNDFRMARKCSNEKCNKVDEKEKKTRKMY
jgi:hypothetical protein